MTLDELLAARDVAGFRYRAATTELHDALIELGGIDEALQNGNAGHAGRNDLLTFFHLPQNLGGLGHPKYSPLDSVTCWRDEIHARRDAILATILASV